jgi:hypothetical protein
MSTLRSDFPAQQQSEPAAALKPGSTYEPVKRLPEKVLPPAERARRAAAFRAKYRIGPPLSCAKAWRPL